MKLFEVFLHLDGYNEEEYFSTWEGLSLCFVLRSTRLLIRVLQSVYSLRWKWPASHCQPLSEFASCCLLHPLWLPALSTSAATQAFWVKCQTVLIIFRLVFSPIFCLMLAQILKLRDIFLKKNCPHTSLRLFHEDCVLAKAIKALQSQADESLRQKRLCTSIPRWRFRCSGCSTAWLCSFPFSIQSGRHQFW